MPKISLEYQNAKLKGDKYYFTNKPCVNGHVSKRVVANRVCYQCLLDKQKKRIKTEEFKKKRREYTKSEKFKSWRRKYLKTDKVKEQYKKYQKTDKYKDIKKKYHQTDRYKEISRKYRKSDQYKKNLNEYQKTENYKISRKKASEKFRKSPKQKKIFERYYKTKKGEDTIMWRTIRIRIKNWCGKKKAGPRSELTNIVGCSKQTLRSHLESKFKPGMNWQNHGKWHIDHIIPLAKFNPNKYDDIKKANHYTNLQPLWASENLKKNKY